MSPLAYVGRLLRWFKGHPWSISAIVACLTLEMGFNAFVPMAFRHLIDRAIVPRDSAVLAHVLAALGVATLLTTAAGVAGDYIYARLSADVLARIRQRLFDHLQTLPPSFFQKYNAGDISARYSTDLAGVEQTLVSWIPWGWKPALDVVGYNLVMFTIDWRLGLLAQLVWPMTLLGPRFFAPKASAAAEARKSKEAALLTAVDEATAGRHVVRAFGLEATMAERFGAKVADLSRTMVRGAFFGAGLERSAGMGILILQIGMLGVGGWMAFQGDISIGSLAAFYSVYLSLSYSLYYLAQYSTSLINSAAGLGRIEEILAERPAVSETSSAPDLPPLRGAIEVRGLVFTPEPGRRILDDVTLTIRAGEAVAFVGPSGSGKSTLLNALMRTFDPDGGAIAIDGFDLRTVSRRSWMEQSAVVFQESFLYHTSIRENVRLGRSGATDAEIEAACRDAEIHALIMAMPRGYDTPVGERGLLLSGGERQRLAIARALVRQPRILFLDEATSALDPGTSAALNATLQRLAAGRTVVSVTHRLETAVHCHRIFVLDRGRLAETGTHAELVARGGLYAFLWRKQTGLHASDDGMHVAVTVERLREIPLLAPLDAPLLQDLAAAQLATENFGADRLVVQEGDPGDKFYLIARGRVEVLRRDPRGIDRQVAVLEYGDNFGELALLGNEKRSATIRTVTPCIFLTLQRQHFQNLLAKSPHARAIILKQQEVRSRSPFEQPLPKVAAPAGTVAG